MVGSRTDSWTSEEDKLLADTILSVVQNGGTQLEAFEKVGKEVNRTSAAVGFRWNSKVRKDYAEELKKAKALRKGTKKVAETSAQEQTEDKVVVQSTQEQIDTKETIQVSSVIENNVTHEDVIRYLEEKNELQKKYDTLLGEHEELKQDYNQLLEIFNRAKEIQKSIQSFTLTPTARKIRT